MARIPFNNIEAHIHSLRIQEDTLTWVLNFGEPDYKKFLKDITEELVQIRYEIRSGMRELEYDKK